MAILLKKVARKNPQEPEASPLYYPVQNTIKQVDETTVAELIADETTLNPAEALMAIRQLRKVMVRELLNSNSVKLGNWGSFSITLNCKGSDSPQKVTASNVEKVNIRFTPGQELKESLQKAEFEWFERSKTGANK